MKFILTPLFNAFFQFWNQLHRQISSVITRVFPTEATHVYGAKKMLKMIPIVRFLRLCPKKIQCPLIYLFEKNLMNYYYSYFTDFLMTCVLEAEITRFVYPWFHCPSYIRIRGRKRTLHKEGTRPSVTWNGLLFRRDLEGVHLHASNGIFLGRAYNHLKLWRRAKSLCSRSFKKKIL